MRTWHTPWLGVVALLAMFFGNVATADEPAKTETATGSVAGTVLYQADPARPWRYSRFYVKNAKSGELAEAVVALRGKGLTGPKSEPTTVKIDQKDFQFTPETVTLRVGDSVTFTNSDQAAHNVRSSSDLADFNVMMPAGGQGSTVKFQKPGGIRQPIELGCVFHGNMKAWIYVFDHPFFQLTAADGKFRWDQIPAGQYELEIVHPAGGLRLRQKVEVKAGETTRVELRVSPDNLQ